MGRRAGSPNRGYFYRSGRGWCTTVNGRMVALRNDEDVPIKDKNTSVAILKAAYRKIIAQSTDAVNSVAFSQTAESANEPTAAIQKQITCSMTVDEVCRLYLQKAKADGAKKTHDDRADTLWDFCTGFSPSISRLQENERQAQMTPANRVHEGYGQLAVSQLLPLHIDQWLSAHPDWKGGKRTRIQAVKRAFNYGVESGVIPRSIGSPLKGYKVPRPVPRVTYLTPEQEAAMRKATNPPFATALKVCIRTGARPGAEFAKLMAKHVKDTGDRMEWVFQANENKTGRQTRKQRIIRITDTETIKVVRELVAKYPQGPIFRNTKGTPWLRKNLEISFRKAKVKLQKEGTRMA